MKKLKSEQMVADAGNQRTSGKKPGEDLKRTNLRWQV